jgi:hypothetical protein
LLHIDESEIGGDGLCFSRLHCFENQRPGRAICARKTPSLTGFSLNCPVWNRVEAFSSSPHHRQANGRAGSPVRIQTQRNAGERAPR